MVHLMFLLLEQLGHQVLVVLTLLQNHLLVLMKVIQLLLQSQQATAVTSDTSFSWTVIGDTNGGTVDKAGTSDIDVLSGTATIAAGSSSTTFVVTPTTDATVEGIEGIQVSVFDGDQYALSSDKVLINNGSAATTQSFALTTGVDEFTGRSGNDSFDAQRCRRHE